MSLSSKIEAAVQAGFTALGDLVGNFTLVKLTTGEYDTTLLKAPVTEKTYLCQGGFSEVDISSLPSGLAEQNVESIILRSNVSPAMGDKLRHHSVEYEIKHVTPVRSYNKVHAYLVYVTR